MAAEYLLVAVCFIYSVSSIDIFSFVNPSICLSQNRIFISSNLSCVECSPSQAPAQNGLFCECRNGYRRFSESSCLECMSGMAVSEDGSFCASCPTGTVFNTATRECQSCNRLSFQDDLYSSGVVERECVQCPSGMQASGDQCVPCRFSDCRCPQESAGVCLDSTESTNFPYLSRTFSYYSTYFASAHYLCIEEDNTTACQLLKNLCALDLYRSDSVACVDVPSVFYSEGGDQLLVQEQISNLFVTRESSQGVHELVVVLASFSLNGSFLGFVSGSKELMLCSDPYIRSLGYWPVGVTYQHQCNVRVDELQTTAEMPVFYSPYLKVGDTLYSIPVLVEDYRSDSGGLVNAGSDRTVWRLVRLFYLAESTSTDGTAINYASFMQLVVEPRGGGLIYPPYLRVRYSTTSDVSSGTVQAEFSVLYEASVLPQQIALAVVVVVLTLLSFVYVGFKVYGFMRRSGRNFCELPTLFFMIAECCSLVAGIVFVILFITCIFILIFFKSQIPLIFVLPTDSQEVLYIVLVALGLLCELVNVAYIMWFQCSTDIFFIDWEKPKGRMVSIDSSKMAPESSLKAAPVSIWRTYFVANEWNEIQSLRKGHPLIMLLAVLLLLQVINLGNIAAKEPITHVFYDVTSYTPPSSRVLRFALAAIFYSLLAVLMRVYVVLIHERFVEHKLKQFVDLCSISNGAVVSILEAAALTGFVILVATNLGPAKTILLTPGVFLMTAFFGMFPCFCSAEPSYGQSDEETGSSDVETSRGDGELKSFCRECCMFLMNSTFAKFLAFCLQAGGIATTSFLLLYFNTDQLAQEKGIDFLAQPWSNALRLSLSVVIICPLLSFLWSGLVKGFIFKFKHSTWYSNLGQLEGKPGRPASRRGGFLYASIRLTVIPFAAYIYMKILNIQPDVSAGFSRWDRVDIAVLVVQILSSFLTFALSLIALWATVQRWAFTLPLLLSTPAAVGWYWLSQVDGVDIFPFYKDTPHFFDFNKDSKGLALQLGVLFTLWIGQVVALGAHIWKSPKYVLARERSLLLSPYYDPVFIDAFMLLNRLAVQSLNWRPISRDKKHSSTQPAVFICSTMYREAEHEMRQMLMSINRVATAIKSNTRTKKSTHYESHIFFDGAIKETKQYRNGFEGVVNLKKFNINKFALQLISLLRDTLDLSLEDAEMVQTPYGYQLGWPTNVLPFFIHLKDNTKVKAKKRWSQVMYMNYIIKHRLKESTKFQPQSTYILTTDADIDFKAESVAALLDFMYRDDSVGAVCARTHPLGSGPLVWYQTFEYAFGHWFQKSAEHVLGCVFCCPGCFSAFRVSAIKDVLDTYQSNVTTASEFLTKDMGEDRWLCTLLIEKGWRLEYAALSENKTFCPETFIEFFKQRRRWIPSTMANLMELLTKAKTIASNNDSISLIYIAYQLVLILATAITPGTILLVVASGIQSIYMINTHAIIGVLAVISILYGIICVKTSEKVQLNIAKALTVGFVVVMAISFAGIASETITFLQVRINGNTTLNADGQNITIDAVYLLGFSLISIIAGLLHMKELTTLLHFVWYILALPSAYLLLMIYSAANLNNRNWGTREKSSGESTSITIRYIKSSAIGIWTNIATTTKRIVFRKSAGVEEPLEDSDKEEESRSPSPVQMEINHPMMDENVKQWLTDLHCQKYMDNFESHGYTSFELIKGMTTTDLQEIGITKQGFLKKLKKKIPQDSIEEGPHFFRAGVPGDVKAFLTSLNLAQYLPIFEAEGYFLPDDMENLISLTMEDLMEMGITKKAHLKMISAGISHLRNMTESEERITTTRAILENSPVLELRVKDIEEYEFWEKMARGVLNTKEEHSTGIKELKSNLEGLRNNTLIAMLVINTIWMVLLLSFNHLKYFEPIGITQSALPVLFAVFFFGILVVQFACLIVHRIETMVHVLARI